LLPTSLTECDVVVVLVVVVVDAVDAVADVVTVVGVFIHALETVVAGCPTSPIWGIL